MAASADVLAQAKVEIDLAAIAEGKNVCTSFRLRRPPQCDGTDLPRPGNHQMARQARLHPPPHPRRNQRSRGHEMGSAARPATRLGPRAKTRMAHNARFASPPPPLPAILAVAGPGKLTPPLPHHRRVHAPRLRPHWRSRRLRRLVLPLPRLAL